MEGLESQVTTPEQEVTEVQEQEQDSTEKSSKLGLVGSTTEETEDTETEQKTNEDETSETSEVTKQEQEELGIIKYLKDKGELPKGVEAFKDEDGKLKFVVPINGKKCKATFKQIVSGFNLEQAGRAKLEEGKALSKQVESLIHGLHSENPESSEHLERLLEKLGHNKAKLAEKWLEEELANAQKTPEELEKEKRYRELEERDRKLKEREQEIEERDSKTLKTQRQEYFSNELIKEMQAAKLDDIKPELKKRIMTQTFSKLYEDRLANKGVENPQLLTVKEALTSVLDDYRLIITDSFEMFGKDEIKKRIPKEFLNTIMKESLNNDEPKNINSFEPKKGVNVDEVKKQKTEPKKMLMSDW
jgi:hypothetical protein